MFCESEDILFFCETTHALYLAKIKIDCVKS